VNLAPECVQCADQQCPMAGRCSATSTCISGVACMRDKCTMGRANADLMCVSQCFSGNLSAAVGAVDAISCVYSTCRMACTPF
ncbi:MAG TPA: hypothetical protein VJT73_20440, partial [Polyangiaceae bacterium]|nr:hypothetical protein [Polyangiaceae bacterium]